MNHILPTITALGTRWYIEVFAESIDADAIHTDLIEHITTYEQRYSRFLQSSLISELNHTGILHQPDQDIQEILRYGQELYRKTAGTFNILVGAELSARGYNSAYTFTPEQPQSSQIIPSPLTDLTITSECITLSAGGVDLGGYGKGYLIDLVATRLQQTHNLEYFLINAGGDMFATSDQGDPITIHLEHPTDTSTSIFTSTLYHQGFAASSAHKRRWTYDGATYTHLVATTDHIDSLDTIGSYVLAASATAADVLATTTLLTPELPLPYIEETKAIVAWFDTTTNELKSTTPLPKPMVQSD